MKKNYAFKYLGGTPRHPKSMTDLFSWRIGEWQETNGPVEPCVSGFHCVRTNGFIYWSDWAPQLFIVEYKGVTVTQSPNSSEEKIAAQKMRVVKRIPITKKFVLKTARSFGLNIIDHGLSPLHTLEQVWSLTHYKSAAGSNNLDSTLTMSRKMAKAVLQEYAPEYL